MLRPALSLLAVWLSLSVASADEYITPLYGFLSRPDIRTPRLEVDVYEPSGVAPGYIFLTPAARADIAEGVNYNFGPTIYDNTGELAWTGYDPALPKLGEVMGFDVAYYHNEPHLAYASIGAAEMSHGNILNENYQLVEHATVGKTVKNMQQHLHRDLHVFNVITPSMLAVEPPPPSRSAEDVSHWVRAADPETGILSATVPKQIFPPVTVCGQNISWVRDFPFQEVSLDGTDTVLFEWNPAEHIPITESLICPGMQDQPDRQPERIGSGPRHGFDFVHRNSIDKLPDGDFVMSARHMNTIYKVSHVDGHIVWRLGGALSDFQHQSRVDGVTFDFGGQHDIRLDNAVPGADPSNGVIGLTLWDNANLRYDAVGATNDRSLGKSLLVDQNTMTAVLVSAFALPGNLLGTNQGSHQILPNGNHLLGGGNLAQVVEYPASAGIGSSPSFKELNHPLSQKTPAVPVFAAHFGGGPMNSYRARRYEWHGQPLTKPDVFAYRKFCDSKGNRTFVYVSWNGATEVESWTVHGASHQGAAAGEFRELASARKSGFETAITVHYDGDDAESNAGGNENEQLLEVYVVAHDVDGKELGRTLPTAVWVPQAEDLTPSHRHGSLDDTTARRKAAHRSRGGDCSERQCHRGFEYSWDRAMDCRPTDETVSGWW